MSILIKDNQTGIIHEYGTNCHDSLHISGDGSCLYYENMQNGDGSMCGGYSFVEDDGKIPNESETADAMHAMCYFNIGGFRTEARKQGEWKPNVKWQGYVCPFCGNLVRPNWGELPNF